MSQDDKIACPRQGGGSIVYDLSSANHDPAIKAKLIEMGWTPPAEHAPVSDNAAPKLTSEVVQAALKLRQWADQNGMADQAWHIANIGDVRNGAAINQVGEIPDHAVEINRLRNVIQAACSGGLNHMIERWKVLFPDAPVPTVHQSKQDGAAGVLLRVIQRLNQNPYSLTKNECIREVEAMRDAAIAAAPAADGRKG